MNSIADLSGDVLANLRDDFSITTVEELVSASARGGEKLRLHLRLTPENWDVICQAGRKLLSPETVERLERALPLPSRFGKGAILGSGLSKGSALGKRLTAG